MSSIGERAFLKNVIIYGKDKSFAQQYATSNGNVFRIEGDMAGCTIKLAQAEYEYSRASITPIVIVEDRNSILTEGTDYVISNKQNTEAGNAAVVVKGMGDYFNEQEVTFTITPVQLADCTLTLSQPVYDGTEKSPSVVLKDKNHNVLTEGIDYSVDVQKRIDVGSEAIAITGMGNYSGMLETTYNVAAADLSGYAVSLDQSSYTYDGTQKKPVVTVQNGDKVLVLNQDYEVVYQGGQEVGAGKVSIKGIGNYTGTIEKTYLVYMNIADCTISLAETSYTYDGTEKKPAVTVQNGDKVLVLNTDYTVSYQSVTDVGTGKVSITGMGYYTDSIEKTYEVKAADLADCTIRLEQSSYTYDGTQKKPAVTVKSGDQVLVLNQDYVVSYQGGREVGTGKVSVSGIENYTGTIEKTYAVHAADLSGCTISLSRSSYTYDGTAKKPSVVVKQGTRVLIPGTDYRITYQNNVNARTGQVIISGIGNYKSSKTAAFKINQASITGLNFFYWSGGYIYNGKAKKPLIKLGSISRALQPGIDYKVTYQQNVNAGTLRRIITRLGNYTNTYTSTYEIKRAEQSLRGTSTYKKAFGAKPFTLNIKRTKGDGALTYKSSNTKIATVSSKGRVTIKGTGLVTITVTAKKTQNYNAKTQKVTIRVSPKRQGISKLKATTGKKLAISWKADARATGYEIQLATDKSFRKDRKNAAITKNRIKTATIKGLKSGKRYYVRIRAYKTVKINGKSTKLYSTWSMTKQSGKIRK